MRTTTEPDLSLASWRDADRLFRALREDVVTVDQPFVLVSQLQRSGGTLLNTLLDGHPQLHSHPHELMFGRPKHDWPALDLAAGVDAWYERLEEGWLAALFAHGYRKAPVGGDAYPRLPLAVVPSFVERLFRVLCAERPPRTQREILGRYLTAFFNAWVDCQGLREPGKLWVSGFGPRLAWGESRRRFFGDYPDGRLVMSHRDPRAWYASARVHKPRYAELRPALALWRQGAREILAAKAKAPDVVFVLTYESLVRDPESTMRAVAGWLGLDWHPVLLQPTFNRLPVPANSSYGPPAAPGIRQDSLDRWRELLPGAVVAWIEADTAELDHAVRAIADVAEPAER
jgi:hypothetical protein